MDFKKKLKTRLITGIAYVLFGALLAVMDFVGMAEGDEFLTLGVAFAVMGIIRIVQYSNLLKNPDKLRSREITERDERNIVIVEKARSLTFTIYILLCGSAVLVSGLTSGFGNTLAKAASYSVCSLILIYYLCCLYFRKKY